MTHLDNQEMNIIKNDANLSKIFEIDSIDKLLLLYNEYGACDYVGEEISQIEHGIQAALLAKDENGEEGVILGALFHDVGHLLGLKYSFEMMDNLGCKKHEMLGSIVLSHIGFPQITCDIVRNHVISKRYLVSKYPQYYDKLSEASRGTLFHQGGKLNMNEIEEFEKKENFDIFIAMRSWDERAKVKNMNLPSFESYREMIERNIKLE
jgi:2-amino-1-hydroxyethylphosphonate dioxygenase (glycine-forming)